MARPQKPLQQKKNGIWFVQVRFGKKRLTESLGTKDEQKALTLCGPVIKRLQAQLDEDLVAAHTRHFPDDPLIEHRIRSLIAPESLPENKKIKWTDLVREHERVFRRKNPNKEGLSPGWHEQMRIAIQEILHLRKTSPTHPGLGGSMEKRCGSMAQEGPASAQCSA